MFSFGRRDTESSSNPHRILILKPHHHRHVFIRIQLVLDPSGALSPALVPGWRWINPQTLWHVPNERSCSFILTNYSRVLEKPITLFQFSSPARLNFLAASLNKWLSEVSKLSGPGRRGRLRVNRMMSSSCSLTFCFLFCYKPDLVQPVASGNDLI